jgi:predicted anti-sigma-YlaC factor YlaD
MDMDCPSCRDVLSARLDGEATPVESVAAEHHLATCAACRTFAVAITRVHRSVRVAPVEVVPDLSAAILAAAPAVGPGPAEPADVGVWRVGLALVALAQVAVALAHVGGGHVIRDQASWEAALGAGFAWAAWRPARAMGLLPLTAVLTVLLLVNGGLGVTGAGTHHLLAPVGLLLLVLATRPTGGARSRPALP